MNPKGNIVLEDGLDLKKVLTTGSVLHINVDYDDSGDLEAAKEATKSVDFIGNPVKSFKDLEKQMVPIHESGWVKKKILEEGGGMPLHKGCTVSIAFSGYWEGEDEPFDTKKADKPLVVNLNDHGLLPGLEMAVMSMLVGEISVFLLTYHVMYGKLGMPPRIKPEASCVFYIKLVKSILTPSEDKQIKLSEPNMFQRVYHEAKLQLNSGRCLFKSNNANAAIHLFKRAEYLLHRCRLADESEEAQQEKMLIKLYINLACCYNATKQPLKACIACNELNRLNSLWNNPKALYQNAKALRMIGEFEPARKRLLRAKKLSDSQDIDKELDLLDKTSMACDKSKLMFAQTVDASVAVVSDKFKNEVDKLIKMFKEDTEMCKLTLPEGLNKREIDYVKEACVRDNLFCNQISTKHLAMDKQTSVDSLDSEFSSKSVVYESIFDLRSDGIV